MFASAAYSRGHSPTGYRELPDVSAVKAAAHAEYRRRRRQTLLAVLAAVLLVALWQRGGSGATGPRPPPGQPRPSSGVAAFKAAYDPSFNCGRIAWVTALQAPLGGSEARFVTSATSYLRSYAAALRSARERAPSLVPVLVTLGKMPRDFVRWVEEQGAIVVPHSVSFQGRMEGSKDPWLLENMESLLPSYVRLDLPLVMRQASKQLPSYLRRQAARGWFDRTRAPLPALPPTMDASMALWSDPDVLFRHDMDTCSIPAPKLLRPGGILDSGVMYVNVAAFAEAVPAMLDFADARKWQFVHAEDLVEQFFYSPKAAQLRQPWHVPSALTDLFSYKAYWGEPEPGWMGMFGHQKVDPVIVHTHGPKPEMALCVVEWLDKNVKMKLEWEPAQVLKAKADIARHCGLSSAPYMDDLLKIAAGAFKADGGDMYRWIVREQDRLCPGVCWVPKKEQEEARKALKLAADLEEELERSGELPMPV